MLFGGISPVISDFDLYYVLCLIKIFCLIHSKELAQTRLTLGADKSNSQQEQLLSGLKYDDRLTINTLAKALTPAKMDSGFQTPLLTTTAALIGLLKKS